MRESRQTKEGKREGEKEKKKGEIEKKTVVAAEGPKVSVIQSVSCCDTALRFCKIVFLHIFYLFSYYCVNLYLTDFKDSLVIKKNNNSLSYMSQVSPQVGMLFGILYLDLKNVAMK